MHCACHWQLTLWFTIFTCFIYSIYLFFKAVRSIKKHTISLVAHALLTVGSLWMFFIFAMQIECEGDRYLYPGIWPYFVIANIIGFLLGYFVLYEQVVDLPRPLFIAVRGSFNRLIMFTSFVIPLIVCWYFNTEADWLHLMLLATTGLMLGRLVGMIQGYRALNRLKHNGEW